MPPLAKSIRPGRIPTACKKLHEKLYKCLKEEAAKCPPIKQQFLICLRATAYGTPY